MCAHRGMCAIAKESATRVPECKCVFGYVCVDESV